MKLKKVKLLNLTLEKMETNTTWVGPISIAVTSHSVTMLFVKLKIVIWLIFQFKNTFANKIEEYAFMFVLGGALGNLGERFVNLLNGNNGKVTDFIELLFIPSFNLADSFITIGISLLIISELKNFRN